MKIEIIVNDHPLKGRCSLEEHFKQNVENFVPYLDKYGNIRDLNPALHNVDIEYPTSPEDDSVHLLINSMTIKVWKDAETLNLGKVMAEMVEEIEAYKVESV